MCVYENKQILFMGDSITALGTSESRLVGYFNEILKPSHFVNIAVYAASISAKGLEYINF